MPYESDHIHLHKYCKGGVTMKIYKKFKCTCDSIEIDNLCFKVRRLESFMLKGHFNKFLNFRGPLTIQLNNVCKNYQPIFIFMRYLINNIQIHIIDC